MRWPYHLDTDVIRVPSVLSESLLAMCLLPASISQAQTLNEQLGGVEVRPDLVTLGRTPTVDAPLPVVDQKRTKITLLSLVGGVCGASLTRI